MQKKGGVNAPEERPGQSRMPALPPTPLRIAPYRPHGAHSPAAHRDALQKKDGGGRAPITPQNPEARLNKAHT